MTKKWFFGVVFSLGLITSLLTGTVASGAQTAVEGAGTLPSPADLLRQGSDPQPYLWEEYGVMFPLPAEWQTIQGGQDFDLALVSPEAYTSGTGSFITVQLFPTLGPGTTLQSALTSVAEQVNSEVTPFATAGLEGATVDFTDEGSGALQHLILLPYGTQGETLYFQVLAASEEDDALVLGILDGMTINPPVTDHAAVDAAWQASLAASGTLVYGSPDAPVHLIEYLDFSCGHCASYSYDMDHLIALEVDSGNAHIEIVLLNSIGGDISTPPTQATYCAAEQGKGYSAYKALFRGYMNEGYSTAYTLDGITRLLGVEDVGVDIEALKACMDDGKYLDVITQSDIRAADAGVTGTPSLLLGLGGDAPAFLKLPSGDQWSGEIPIHILRIVIKAALEDGLSLQAAADAYFNQ